MAWHCLSWLGARCDELILDDTSHLIHGGSRGLRAKYGASRDDPISSCLCRGLNCRGTKAPIDLDIQIGEGVSEGLNLEFRLDLISGGHRNMR